jgi:DNA-binding transcriptional LysR family regulator
MTALARRGTCIAFQTRIGLEPEIKAGHLVFLPLADRRLPSDRLMLVRRNHLAPKTAAGAFLDFAKRRLSKMAEGGKGR